MPSNTPTENFMKEILTDLPWNSVTKCKNSPSLTVRRTTDPESDSTLEVYSYGMLIAVITPSTKTAQTVTYEACPTATTKRHHRSAAYALMSAGYALQPL